MGGIDKVRSEVDLSADGETVLKTFDGLGAIVEGDFEATCAERSVKRAQTRQ